MKKYLTIAILSIVLCGCQTVMKTAYGIKKPKLETDESIRRYLKKKDVDTSNVLVFKDFNSFAIASQLNYLNIPEAFFFNKEGYLVRYKKEAVQCNANVGTFISDLSQFSSLPDDRSVKMKDLFMLFKNAKIPQGNADITVLITWTVYAGKLNKEKAFEWTRVLDNAKANGLNVQYYLLNCDLQKNWNLPKQLLERLGI